MMKLKVSRLDTPKHVPFPLVYLYKEDERDAIRQAFYALFEFRPHHLRLEKWAQVRIDSEEPYQAERVSSGSHALSPTLKSLVPDLFTIDSPWYLGVPVLVVGSAAYQTEHILGVFETCHDIPDPSPEALKDPSRYVAYLSARGNWRVQRGKPPVAEPNVVLDPTFVVRDQEEVGVCSSCPRYAHNAAGKCFFGDPVCGTYIKALGAPMFLSLLAKTEERDGLL